MKDHPDVKISEACKIFEITSKKYRLWKKKRENPSASQIQKAAEDEMIKDKMIDIVKTFGFVPGRRTFCALFTRMHFNINSQPVGEKKVTRLMQELNLFPNLRHKDAYKGQATYNHPYYNVNDYVKRYFRQDPRKVILTDITYISYNGNKNISYLCVFKDAFTNEILGWHISKRMDVTLVERAYCMMMDLHEKEIEKACKYMKENGKKPYVYIHSDNGSQYLSTEFREILEDDGFIQSVSRRGNSLDNAPMESFFGRMKSILNELVEKCPNFDTVETMIKNFMEQYNTVIPQYDLAGQTPEEYYRYITEGIYQTDVYFGVSAKELITQEELESRREQARAERARRRSKQNESGESSYEYKSEQHPFKVVQKDQKVILARINKLRRLIDENTKEVEKLDTLLEDTKTALIFLAKASDSVIKSLYYPRNWQNYPELSYVNRTGAIY